METNRLLSRQFEGDSAHLTGLNLFARVVDTVKEVKGGAVALSVVVIAMPIAQLSERASSAEAGDSRLIRLLTEKLPINPYYHFLLGVFE